MAAFRRKAYAPSRPRFKRSLSAGLRTERIESSHGEKKDPNNPTKGASNDHGPEEGRGQEEACFQEEARPPAAASAPQGGPKEGSEENAAARRTTESDPSRGDSGQRGVRPRP